MADEAEKMGMGHGTVFVVTGPRLFGVIHAAAAQAVYADRSAGGVSMIAYADGVKSYFDAHPDFVAEHEVRVAVELPSPEWEAALGQQPSGDWLSPVVIERPSLASHALKVVFPNPLSQAPAPQASYRLYVPAPTVGSGR